MHSATNNAAISQSGVPPKLAEQKGRHRPAFLFAALALACGLAILFYFKPGHHAFYPACHFHSLTGLHCPGCGSLRALHELTHGNLIEAARLNALLLLCLAGVAWLALRFALANLRRQRFTFSVPTAWLWAFLSVAVAFGVLRNLPGFAWLAP